MSIKQPSEAIKKLLQEKVERSYATEIANGNQYSISYSYEQGQQKAVVSFYSASSTATAIYELKTHNNGEPYWYMVRDWND
ncbi:hypothetical protein [uncultured Acinetobacter sp.]|uniref:hypothetical protein n=1 Tax=uncultured Acinetobacter sp. TaxID=165433 RepID=UPI002601D880|nr:hypothetical protein [uncultured Acinetobacter sp.]